MAVNESMVLEFVKARLNRLPTDTTHDAYLQARISAAVEELTRNGISLTDDNNDLILVADTVVWEYQSRDNPGGMPDWLRLRRRERWLRGDART